MVFAVAKFKFFNFHITKIFNFFIHILHVMNNFISLKSAFIKKKNKASLFVISMIIQQQSTPQIFKNGNPVKINRQLLYIMSY